MAFHKLIVSVVRCRRALLILGALGFCGCVVVGPRSITAGRAAYTEVINRTTDQQILNVIVRQRYDETFGMLSVVSVTASLRFRAETGTNLGFGAHTSSAAVPHTPRRSWLVPLLTAFHAFPS